MSKKPVTIRIINRVDNYLGGAAAFYLHDRIVYVEDECRYHFQPPSKVLIHCYYTAWSRSA